MKRIGIIGFAVLTLALALSACSSGKQTDSQSKSNSNDSAAKQVVIKASNYKFDQAEYRVKVGEPVKFVLESSGNHGLSVKELDLNLDPNSTSQVVTPDKAGTYEFICTIMCGPGHKDMVAKIIVE
ncbi:cupredoxin domain-containing protein [Paenibacillus sp. 481]|uniref:cupredoxin domain-containing protein n=1 Tax=Paenibacillus sp. 481 TaxID=2835869 RepID=UPI001E321A67|nr:cupredoxin domain-containing protein [Paenibacillus sp. 481]UHA72320.1 cupredoxin domain-containing protein [Paenibacillus sp. 481]